MDSFSSNRGDGNLHKHVTIPTKENLSLFAIFHEEITTFTTTKPSRKSHYKKYAILWPSIFVIEWSCFFICGLLRQKIVGKKIWGSHKTTWTLLWNGHRRLWLKEQVTDFITNFLVTDNLGRPHQIQCEKRSSVKKLTWHNCDQTKWP